jgi:hypothetical protein
MAEKKKSLEEIIREKVAEGGIHAMLYFDVHGNSEQALRTIMVDFIGRLTKEPGVEYVVGEIEKPIADGELYSTYGEVRILVDDFPSLVNVCFNFAPVGIEILDPLEIKLRSGSAQTALMNVSSASQNFTKLVMEKILTPQQKADLQRKMEARSKIGKMLVEKKGAGQ